MFPPNLTQLAFNRGNFEKLMTEVAGLRELRNDLAAQVTLLSAREITDGREREVKEVPSPKRGGKARTSGSTRGKGS